MQIVGQIMTSITLENCYGKYTVEIDRDDMDMEETVCLLVRPVILAAGYTEANVNDWIEEG